MYIPKHFKMKDLEQIYQFIELNSFATIISLHHHKPYATHLPLILDRKGGVLHGHFARHNEQWIDIVNQRVLVIFHGPHSYISPSWYEDINTVPTWNYEAVHVYGEVELMEDTEQLLKSLEMMVQKYELKDSEYRLEKVDKKYFDGLSKGIIGFKVRIEELEGKSKLSQNHPVERRLKVMKELEATNGDNQLKIAKLMKDTLID